MRIPRLLISIVAALFILGALPEISHAQDDKSAVKSKRKKAKRKKGKRGRKAKKARAEQEAQIDEDPYASEEAAPEEAADAEAPAADGESAPPAEEEEPKLGRIVRDDQAGGEGSLRRSGRMEFDERLVKGQAAKSGAVYLFKRVPRRLPGLVPMRRSYRRRIVEPVLGERELKPAEFSTSKESTAEPSKAKGENKTGAKEGKATAKPDKAANGRAEAPKKVKKNGRRKNGGKN